MISPVLVSIVQPVCRRLNNDLRIEDQVLTHNLEFDVSIISQLVFLCYVFVGGQVEQLNRGRGVGTGNRQSLSQRLRGLCAKKGEGKTYGQADQAEVSNGFRHIVNWSC